MGGGGAEVIYLNWCWGGGGGQVFWVDRIAPSKNIKTSTIWKDFCDKRLPQKLLWGGGKPNNAPNAEKEIPPHTEKSMAPAYVERKDCPHKNTPIRETPPPPPDGFFYSCFPHLASAYIPPLACADHDL